MFELQLRFPEGKAKTVTLSYDDGSVYDAKLVEMIDRAGIKCTFNINSGLYAKEATGSPFRMTKEATFKLYENGGHEVASHAVTHPHIAAQDSANGALQVLEDRANLEEMTGYTVRGFAYPYGSVDDKMVETLRTCGICYARTTDETESFAIPTDWLRLNPTCYHRNPKLDELCDKFLDKSPVSHQAPWMFYMWGHSSDYNRENEWYILEKFCERFGHREDIWFATNIEIYDYVQAYKNLRWSVGGAFVENPTNIDVWFRKDGEVYVVKAGQTLRF